MIERYSRPRMKRIWSEENRYDQWLKVEIAVCDAWAKTGVIPREAIPKIKLAKYNIKRIAQIFQETHHDMTAFLGSVAESVGEESRFIHLGLTSSDVMDTALSLQLIEAANLLIEDVKLLTDTLAHQALEHKYTLIMGRTHGIHAEPTTFGLKLALWVEEMRRNLHRLNEAKNIIAVGKISGAVGTHATVPPEVEAKACRNLKLVPAPVSSQIIQRDRHAQFVTTLAIIASSLEKFATEIRGLQRTEVREVEEPFGLNQTGSSAMPHKRNPELCERICGLARLVRGYALTSMENIALWHERDISHSSAERIILPDSCLLLDYALSVFNSVMEGLQVFPGKMRKNLEITRGLVFSQRVMLALIDKGLSRQQAYQIVQRHAMKSWKSNRGFLSLLKDDAGITSVLPEDELAALFDYQYFLCYVDEIFARVGLTASQWPGRGVKTPELPPRSGRA